MKSYFVVLLGLHFGTEHLSINNIDRTSL